jgi:hypothetical protein
VQTSPRKGKEPCVREGEGANNNADIGTSLVRVNSLEASGKLIVIKKKNKRKTKKKNKR